MKKLLLASALIATAGTASAGSLEPLGDRIGIHRHNGCEVIVYAEPRRALFGLLTTNWDYTPAGRECRDEQLGVDDDDGDDEPVIDTKGPVRDNDLEECGAACT